VLNSDVLEGITREALDRLTELGSGNQVVIENLVEKILKLIAIYIYRIGRESYPLLIVYPHWFWNDTE